MKRFIFISIVFGIIGGYLLIIGCHHAYISGITLKNMLDQGAMEMWELYTGASLLLLAAYILRKRN